MPDYNPRLLSLHFHHLPLAWLLVVPAVAQSGWTPGPAAVGATTEFSVDHHRRNAVASFWNVVYGASEGFEARMAWSGNYSSCNRGATARAFHDDVQRRINFMRALAGVPSGTLVNDATTVFIDTLYNPPADTLRMTAAQHAAYMLAKHRDALGQPVVTHTPSNHFTCFSAAAGNGCLRGSLAYGFCGPDAIDEYLRESDSSGLSIWSATAGHRRWILLPGATTFATGDTPGGVAGGVAYQPTNALYCVPTTAELLAVPARFTAWPPAGYVPDGLNTRVWSLSYPGADFSTAAVTMSGPAGPVAVTILDRTSTGYGNPAIVWQVPAAVGTGTVAADTVYQVSVTGIGGAGVPAAHSYAVTLFDPDTLNEPLAFSGSDAPPASGANYFFGAVDLADGYEVEIAEAVTAAWTEGAEDAPAPRVVDGTSAAYQLRVAMPGGYFGNFWRTGAKAFRLAFPYYVNPPAHDWFELDRELVTGAAASLNLYSKRGYSRGSKVVIETSVDDGTSWQAAGAGITGRTDNSADTAFTGLSVALPPNQPAVRVRFRHVWTGGAFYSVESYPTQPVGIFIDDITTTTGVKDLQPLNRVPLAAGAHSVRLDSATIGRPPAPGNEFRLRLRASLGLQAYPFGPTKVVTVTGTPLGGFSAWQAYEVPLLSGGFDDDDDGDGEGNGIEYAFGSDPLAGGSVTGALEVDHAAGELRLSKSLTTLRSDLIYAAETSTDAVNWTSNGVQVTFADGELVARVPLDSATRFLRWRVERDK
jgi:hypothetical protein